MVVVGGGGWVVVGGSGWMIVDSGRWSVESTPSDWCADAGGVTGVCEHGSVLTL